jgi:hypothetical protein
MWFLNKLTAAVYIKLYKRHDYPMKNDVTNMQYYKYIYRCKNSPYYGGWFGMLLRDKVRIVGFSSCCPGANNAR